MEYFSIDIVVGQGGKQLEQLIYQLSLSLWLVLPQGYQVYRGLFLVVLGFKRKLDYYDETAFLKSLREVLICSVLRSMIAGSFALAKRSRGTPRIANRLLKRVHDFALIQDKKAIDPETVSYALKRLNIDEHGLDKVDRDILTTIAQQYGGPVGLETLAVTLGEEKSTIEDVYEPFLVNSNLIKKTCRRALP